MKILKALSLEKYNDKQKYAFVDGVIYEDKEHATYCVTLYCELEAGEEEDLQYPLEDILEKYYVNCTDYIDGFEIEGKTIYIFEIEGSLNKEDKEENLKNVTQVAALIGKRVFNYVEYNCVKLGIEDM